MANKTNFPFGNAVGQPKTSGVVPGKITAEGTARFWLNALTGNAFDSGNLDGRKHKQRAQKQR